MLRLFWAVLFASILSTTLFLQGCSTSGTSSASPVASIPLPEEGTITVSNPDSSTGLSVVTGSANAAPSNAIIIVQISATSALNFNLPETFTNLVNPAYAAETSCSSDLPTCPEVSSDNECQFTANEDGSFIFQVPAESSTEITLGYLDADDSCAETFYEEEFTIDADVLSLNMDVSYTTNFDNQDGDQTLYFLGVDEDSDTKIAILDTSADNPNTSPAEIAGLSSITGAPTYLFVDDFEEYDGQLIGISTTENLYITIHNEETGLYDNFTIVSDADDASSIPNGQIVDFNAYTFTSTEIQTGGCDAIYSGEDLTYERALILSTETGYDDLYVITDVDPEAIASEDGRSARSYSPDLSSVSLDSYTIERYFGAVEKDSHIYVVAQMRGGDPTSPGDFVAVLKFGANNAFCNNNDFVILDYTSIANGDAAENYQITILEDGDSALANGYVVVLNIDEQILSFIDISTTLTTDNYDNLSEYTGLTHTTYIKPRSYNSDNGGYSLFAFADNSEGAEVLAYNTTTPVLTNFSDLSSQFTLMDPMGAYYDNDASQIYLIDSGIDGDFITTILYRDVNIEE